MKAGAVVVLTAVLCGCNPQAPHTNAPPSPAATSTAVPPLTVTGNGTAHRPAVITQQNGNRKVYQIISKSYVSHSAQNVMQATFARPTVTFYAKDGTKLTATAPSAGVQNGKAVVLSGGVRATTSSGLTLTCDELTYDQKSETIDGRGNVHITGMQGGARQELTGNHFTSDVRLTNMVIN